MGVGGIHFSTYDRSVETVCQFVGIDDVGKGVNDCVDLVAIIEKSTSSLQPGKIVGSEKCQQMNMQFRWKIGYHYEFE